MSDEPEASNEENSSPLPAKLCWTSCDEDALRAAVWRKDPATFDYFEDYFVKHNMDLNHPNSFGETPLLICIICLGSSALIKRLLELGCDVNIADKIGRTPLHVAILNHDMDIAHKLIEHGADLDVQDLATKETPLFYAIKYNNIEAVCMLLCYGADVTIQNAENYTPLTFAMKKNKRNIVLILVDYCDDFNYSDNDGYMPLHMVMKYGSDLAMRLIDAGADVNGVTNDGDCVLEFAMDRAGADVFKKIWGQMNVNIVLESNFPLLLNYIKWVWHYSANEWVECLYLMLESPIAIDLMDRCTVYCASSMENGFITELLDSLQEWNVTSRDRQNIINICLTLGAEVTVADLDVTMQLFGYKEEFKTLVYATEHYKNPDICHPLLPFIIGLSDFDSLSVMCWCWDNIKAERPWEMELICNVMVSYLEFFSLTSFWKQILLQDCQSSSGSNYKFIGKIKTAYEFPSLLELCRNKVHSLIKETGKVQKPYKFFDALKGLPLPGVVIDLLLFKRPIYR